MLGERSTGPEPNPTPRRETELKPRQEAFVLAILGGMGKVEAVKAAGYEVASDDAARAQASRLLRTASVKVATGRAKLKAIQKMDRTAEATLLRYHLEYLEAMAARDFSAAVSALRDISKYYGLFEQHNRQKNYSREDIERMKRELEELGMD